MEAEWDNHPHGNASTLPPLAGQLLYPQVPHDEVNESRDLLLIGLFMPLVYDEVIQRLENIRNGMFQLKYHFPSSMGQNT